MKAFFTKEPKSIDQIVSVFDKTLEELNDRIRHDEQQAAAAEEEHRREVEEHQKRVAELIQKKEGHKGNVTRAQRIAGNIQRILN